MAEPESPWRSSLSTLPPGWRVVKDALTADPWDGVELVVPCGHDDDLVVLRGGVVWPLRARGDFSGNPAVRTWGEFVAHAERRERQRAGHGQ